MEEFFLIEDEDEDEENFILGLPLQVGKKKKKN